MTSSENSKPVILTGDRTTGPLHLGHYVGSLRNRVALQDTHEQYLLLADMQALTDNADDPEKVSRNVIEVALDYLAVGIDPDRTTICVQSYMPALCELTMFYMNIVTVARLERNPTIKDEIKSRGFEKGIPAGFLVYPIAQAADITGFRATVVPVGEDQLPLIEQTNEIIRRLNRLVDYPVFEEVDALVSECPRLPGVDGKAKMGKSLGNAIALSASADEVTKSVMQMFTDPDHLRVEDPGKVEGNMVFTYMDAFDEEKDEVAALKEHYQRGGLGDVVLKRRLNDVLQALLAPIREKRAEFARDPEYVMGVLREGTERGREITSEVFEEVRGRVGLFRF